MLIRKLDDTGHMLSALAQIPLFGYIASAGKVATIGIIQIILALIAVILTLPLTCCERGANCNLRAWEHVGNGAKHLLIGVGESTPIIGSCIGCYLFSSSRHSSMDY